MKMVATIKDDSVPVYELRDCVILRSNKGKGPKFFAGEEFFVVEIVQENSCPSLNVYMIEHHDSQLLVYGAEVKPCNEDKDSKIFPKELNPMDYLA